MFNKIHGIGAGENSAYELVFVGSKYVKAFPSGRRRALKDAANNLYIPFDQEAKLNTEFNNRKHTSLNGLASSFYNGKSWSTDALKVVIGGYSFDISLNEDHNSINNFCRGILNTISTYKELNSTTENIDAVAEDGAIYVNIKLEKTPLYESTDAALDCDTWVLRNQSSADAISYLDIAAVDNPTTSDNYYFSGLSFSRKPVATTPNGTDRFFKETSGSGTVQQDYSLKLFVYNTTSKNWSINPKVMLPEIEHGDTEHSIKLNELFVNSIKQGSNKLVVPTLEVLVHPSTGERRLRFRTVTETRENFN